MNAAVDTKLLIGNGVIYIYIYIYKIYKIYIYIYILPWLSPLRGFEDGVGVAMTFTGKFLYMAHHFILLRSIPLNLCWKGGMVVWALCHGCGFDYQQKRLKTFPGAGYLCSDDGVVWLWHYYIYIYLYLPTYLPPCLPACLPTYPSNPIIHTNKQLACNKIQQKE